MKIMIKMSALVCVLTTVAMLFTGCGSAAESSDLESTKNSTASSSADGGKFYDGQIKIACTTWIGYAPLFVAQEVGIFEKNGVDVSMNTIESSGDIKAAVASDQVQGYAMTVDTITMDVGAGLDTVQVLALDTSDGGDGIICKNKYNSLQELKGASVAVDTSGGASIFYFCYLLDKEGMSLSDFNIQNMDAGNAGAAFVGGDVDAAVTWEPWLTNAKKAQDGKVLRTSAEDPGVIADSLCFNREIVEEYPDTVQAIVNSWFEALDYINDPDTQDEAYNIMAESQGMSLEDFMATLPTVSYYDLEKNKEYLSSGKMEEVCKSASDFCIEMNFINDPVDTGKIIDSTFIDNAMVSSSDN